MAGVVEEADRQRQQRVAGDSVQLRAEGGEGLGAGGNGSDIDEHDVRAIGVSFLVFADHGAWIRAAGAGIGERGSGLAGLAGRRGRSKEAVVRSEEHTSELQSL